MKSAALSIALKEWAAVVEAMGSGQQTVMIRTYEPKHAEFLLYPTFTFYATLVDKLQTFDELFQERYQSMARKAGKYATQRGKEELFVDINYFGRVDNYFQVEGNKVWKELEPYFIWNS
jgi:hypothetical protein